MNSEQNVDSNEVEAAVQRYVELREAVDAGDAHWSDFAELFTEDAVYVDPAWGRIEGLGEIRRLVFSDAMAGLEDWKFPLDFVMISGSIVVMKWRQEIPGADGSVRTQSGVSTLVYDGEGKFNYQEDLLNMVHVLEDLKASQWRPAGGFHLPPAEPVRDFTPPKGYGQQ